MAHLEWGGRKRQMSVHVCSSCYSDYLVVVTIQECVTGVMGY
jgi:hypothetical protein